MKSRSFFDELVSDLTELEMQSLLEAAYPVVQRNNWEDMMEDAFGIDVNERDQLEKELDEVREDNEELENDLDDYKSVVKRALKSIADGKMEDVKNILTEV